MKIAEKAFAKLTLTLRLLDKREDGFNNIDALTTYCSDLYDILSVEANILTSLKVANDSTVEKDLVIDDSNLILKAHKLFINSFREFKNEDSGYNFEIEKHIPSGAGLGGGSADSAATFRVLNNLYQNQFNLDQLIEMAGELGSDIPGCIISKMLKMTDTGKVINVIESNTDFLKGYQTLIITPDIFCPTPEIYKHYDVISRPTHEGIEAPSAFASLTDNFHNDLEIAALDRFNELSDFKNHIEKIGRETFLLAGSGSSIFCILDTDRASSLYNKLKIELENELIHEKIRQLAVTAIC